MSRRNHRGAVRRSFTKIWKELKDELDKQEQRNEEVLSTLFTKLEDRIQQLMKIDDEIMKELCEQNATEAEMDEEYESTQEYRDKWNELSSQGKPTMTMQNDQSTISSVEARPEKTRYKLPKLKLVEFSGCPREWLSFWSQFKGIHEDGQLSPEEKFQYLIQATVAESAARRVVSSFPPTAENYGKAIAHLKSRFGKENVLVEVYVRDLLKVVLTNTNGQQRLPLATLYDRLETQLRSLESLGVTSDKYAAMLYPLVESSISQDVLLVWERIRNQRSEEMGGDEDQLKMLMTFLRGEVESSIRLEMAKHSVTSEDDSDGPPVKQRKLVFESATTSDLLNKSSSLKCIFCDKGHQSQDCLKVDKLKLSERFSKIRMAKRCFKCLKLGHFAWNCKASLKCPLCDGNHYKLLCTKDDKKPLKEINAFSAYDDEVIMQTLLLNLTGPNKRQAVRTLLDGGSGRSYISSPAVKNFGFQPIGTIELAHSLFGGHVTKFTKHSVYEVDVSSIDNTLQERFQLIEVEKICSAIDPVRDGPWIVELSTKGIQLSDVMKKECPIHMLLGANITSKLYTGKMYQTKDGPVAFETKFGWTLTGAIADERGSAKSTVLLVHTMFIGSASIQDLWNLDIIGIHDPEQEKSQEELAKSAQIHFEENVRRLEDGRYEVALPWIEGHQSVAVNREIAEHRLHSSMRKLENLPRLEQYQKVFDEWLTLGIIEEVEDDDYERQDVSYLPHHPVFNAKSSTTPIRPVFDASARSNGFQSLNGCLEKGKNLLNDIPTLLILFRMKLYAAIADIKKAFLQISVTEKDRNYLRFLWYKYGKIIILRHCRVVFGISSSPFLLAATINYHLDNVKQELQEVAQLLKRSLFVDNCVVSVDTKEERDRFIVESTKMCADAKFELRGWVWNGSEVIAGDVSGVGSPECGLEAGSNASQETSTSVLGLLWNVCDDTISLDMRKVLQVNEDVVTKRTILSATHQIFDPIGIAVPVTIVPKILIQDLHKKKFKWDVAVPEEIKKKFLAWKTSLGLLTSLKIPRWIGSMNGSEKSLHVFTDASQRAYTAVAFLRCKNEDETRVQLLLAKSRVATIKPMTMPRLELVACECGAKMADFLQKTLNVKDADVYLWSDSGNALSWIKRSENWQVFVSNRVKKINQLTNADNWLHIPGHLNPADLPSRGCNVKQLLDSKWWDGPEWLRKEKEFWPRSTIVSDERIVMSEKRKVVISHLIQERESMVYFRKFSNLRKVIRMIAWMKRWKTYKRGQKSPNELSIDEENEAEKSLWCMIQKESFEESDKILTQLKAKKDESGLWKVETKLLLRNDTEGFRRPILLPKNHPAVDRLVEREHLDMRHCGPQVLRCNLRERFWILDVRRTVRRIQQRCKRCIRYTAKKLTAPEPTLPSNRVRDAAIFEVTGIDLGGPLILLDERKAWFVIFTCAVYRAIHLELITSLSTPAFIQALRRFIARRGRPEVVYTDNGTNFVGTENLMEKLNWEEIAMLSDAKRIRWIFNPPSAPWWGGWWERIVGLVKELLRKCLGRAVLDYEEMATVLCDCEQVINSRPLTYLSEEHDELRAITPMMFLSEARSSEVVDLDKIESSGFGNKFMHRQEIRRELRERFRKEYLSLLVHHNNRKSGYGYTPIKVDDVVIMEVENKKRVDWPLARVIQVFPSQDGVIRSVRIRVVKDKKISEVNRPIQRLYMLEAAVDSVKELVELKGERIEVDSVQKTNEEVQMMLDGPNEPVQMSVNPNVGVQMMLDGSNEPVQMSINPTVGVQMMLDGPNEPVQMSVNPTVGVQMMLDGSNEPVQMSINPTVGVQMMLDGPNEPVQMSVNPSARVQMMLEEQKEPVQMTIAGPSAQSVVDQSIETVRVTRSGRKVNKPDRYQC